MMRFNNAKVLSDYSGGRDNNFNLIRVIAALSVLVSHSFTLAIGSIAHEPFEDTVAMSLGGMAVDVFFVTSGFLVANSLISKCNVFEFVLARILRIFPALVVMTTLAVIFLSLFSSLPAGDYFKSPEVYWFWLKSCTVLGGIWYTLPGVFAGSPYRLCVNASLWTIPYEVYMYGVLLGIWYLCHRLDKRKEGRFTRVVPLLWVAVTAVIVIYTHFLYHTTPAFAKLSFMFFSGAAYAVNRHRVRLYPSLIAAICLLMGVAIFARRPDMFYFLYLFGGPYLLLYLAYVPGGAIRGYNRLGDYSYGIYLYAFVIQQSVVALLPGISAWGIIAIAGPISIFCSVLSWHLIEKRFLAIKSSFAMRPVGAS